MQAMVFNTYGSPEAVLQLKTVEKPTPKDHEVLVRIHAASVNAADWRLMRGAPFLVRLEMGLKKPKYPILGGDIAGVVEAVGRHVSAFKPGDAVFGDLSGCGFGGFAEYAAVPEQFIALKPNNLTFEQAAAVPMAAITALQALRDKAGIQPGHKVLINGASGGVGTFAVQIAKAYGAEVTAVCSPAKIEMVRALGADHIIDYTQENFTRSGKRYDRIIAVNGFHPITAYQHALTPDGVYVMAGGSMQQIFQALLLGPLLSLRSRQKLGSMTAKPNQNDLNVIRELIETNAIMPVIERRYPLSDLAQAVRHVEKGHARGKIVITIAQTEASAPLSPAYQRLIGLASEPSRA
jgi:NADPH:quinone reductase-like Zn-dependent oxidoreductase